MAQENDYRWLDGDSLRSMVRKYNAISRDIESAKAELADIESQLTSVQSSLRDVSSEVSVKIPQSINAVNKYSVGLGNVDNTADTDKPVSTATRAAIDAIAQDMVDTSDVIEDIITSGDTLDSIPQELIWGLFMSKQVYFGLTDDGRFAAYSPETWDDLQFGTEDGRLTISMEVTH